ncbi:hypothetical protein FCF93_16115 [Salmonella enterica]|nr:hypothetical protein [Salmonella enterica]
MLLLIYGAFKHLQYRSDIQLSPLCRTDKTQNNPPLSLPMRLLAERCFTNENPYRPLRRQSALQRHLIFINFDSNLSHAL